MNNYFKNVSDREKLPKTDIQKVYEANGFKYDGVNGDLLLGGEEKICVVHQKTKQ